METITDTGLDHRRIEQLIFGTIKSKLLLCAVKLKVFDLLDTPVNSENVAATLKTHPDNTRLMLNGLTACNLVRYKDGKYENTGEARAFLSSKSTACITGWLGQAVRMFEPILDNLETLVKNGPMPPGTDTHMNSEAMCELYTHAHAQTELAGVAAKTAGIIRHLPEFSSMKRMLDLGGGPGLNSVAIVQAHDTLESVVFDRASVVAIARGYIERFGCTGRITTLSGDYTRDDPGKGFDLVLASDTLYYQGGELERITDRVYNALNPGGVLVGIHGVVTKDRTGPGNMVLGMLPDALMAQGELPCEGFLAPALFRAGFKQVQTRKVFMVSNEMEVDIARK